MQKTTWPPPEQRDIETGHWSRGDLRVGDLLFGQRSGGMLTWLCEAADEPWRHVGSLIEEDGELMVVEILGDAFRLNTLDYFFDPKRSYVGWGAARMRVAPECVAAANDWMRSHVREGDRTEQVYAWDDLILAGVIAATHRGLLALDPQRLRAAIMAAGQRCKESLEFRGELSLTCSAFVQFAYENAGGRCVIEHPRWRSEPVSWPERSPLIDELFEMSEQELAGFDDVSLVDVLLESERIDRSTGTTRIQPGQVGELLRVFCAALGGYAFGDPPPRGLGVDSRWVTPGDLWRSPSVLERALVNP